MPLLIPLDSPLSWVSNRIDILQIRWRFAPFGVKPLFYFAFGVCLYLFCVIIISSILHNVKRFLRLFRLHIAQQKSVHFGDLALFSKCGIWYNKSVRACEASGICADAARGAAWVCRATRWSGYNGWHLRVTIISNLYRRVQRPRHTVTFWTAPSASQGRPLAVHATWGHYLRQHRKIYLQIALVQLCGIVLTPTW